VLANSGVDRTRLGIASVVVVDQDVVVVDVSVMVRNVERQSIAVELVGPLTGCLEVRPSFRVLRADELVRPVRVYVGRSWDLSTVLGRLPGQPAWRGLEVLGVGIRLDGRGFGESTRFLGVEGGFGPGEPPSGAGVASCSPASSWSRWCEQSAPGRDGSTVSRSHITH
jgi:hypothetical protein